MIFPNNSDTMAADSSMYSSNALTAELTAASAQQGGEQYRPRDSEVKGKRQRDL